MQLLRLALLEFDPFPDDVYPLTFDMNEVRLETIESLSDIEKKRICVVAGIKLQEWPHLDLNNRIIIPEIPRKRAELAIELAAGVIAVSDNCSHFIGSPWPAVALLMENDQERDYLLSSGGLAVEYDSRAILGGELKVSDAKISQVAGDRVGGVLLLAEALAHEHPTGRFHELIRLFEHAFGLSSYSLVKALSSFLQGTRRGYTEEEVKRWVIDLRDPATHADGKIQEWFVLQSDIRPVIRRMEQAAYDVLLNKAKWHVPSTERNQVWSPLSGTTSTGSDIFIIQGKDTSITFEHIDEFRAYPANLNVAITQMPDDWWSDMEPKTMSVDQST